MKQISQLLSAIFSPLLVPTYGIILGLWATLLVLAPVNTRIHVAIITCCITAVIPAIGIFVLYRLGVIGSTGLNDRTDRTVPYIITGVAYLACMFYLIRANAPSWLWLFIAGGFAATVVSAVINRWWKISAHMAAMGGLMAITFIIWTTPLAMPGVGMMIWFAATVFASGAVGTARVYLGRHTLAQVLAGTANGFLCVWIASLFA